jgi:hypothetical protein
MVKMVCTTGPSSSSQPVCLPNYSGLRGSPKPLRSAIPRPRNR